MNVRRTGRKWGAILTTLLNQSAVQDATVTNAVQPVKTLAVPVPKKKHGWLPVLTVLFLISYGLMTMLIVEQGQTIESQRVLIRELFRDSVELSAVKRAQIGRNAAEAQNPTPSAKAPAEQIPTTQNPSTQAPVKQTPSSQAAPQHQAQKQNEKPEVKPPSRPASDLADEGRSLITI